MSGLRVVHRAGLKKEVERKPSYTTFSPHPSRNLTRDANRSSLAEYDGHDTKHTTISNQRSQGVRRLSR